MPLRDDSSALIGFAKVMRDHTERKQAEQIQAELLQREQEARREVETAKQEAEEAKRIAEAANHAKDEFMALVTHELRPPLTIVSGWSDLLQRQDIDPEMQKSALEAIIACSRS